ncbi:MAG: amino acid adenylation domain-containing protein, partial [Ginsengibacter sp.]
MGKRTGLSSIESIPSLNVGEALKLFDSSLNVNESNIVASDVQLIKQFSFSWIQQSEKKIAEPIIKVKGLMHSSSTSSVSNTSVYDFIKELVAEATDMPIDEMNDNDSFTNMGLDSLNAIDIIKKIEEKYELQLHPTLLFEHDSISALSSYLLKEKLHLAASEAIGTTIKIKILPLLPAQKTFYANQIFYHDAPCNSLVRLDYEKHFDFNLLQQCWNKVVQINESLRCSFRMCDEGPLQYIENIKNQKIEQYNIDDKSDPLKQLNFLENTIINKVYRLDQSPLFNLCLINYPSARTSIILCVHHIISDAWSMSLILKELMYLYEQEQNGTKNTFIKDQGLFAQYVLHSTRDVANHKLDQTRNYWLNELKGFDGSYKAFQNSIPGERKGKYHNIVTEFDKSTTEIFLRRCKRFNATPVTFLISSYFILIKKVYGIKDAIIRVATSNRDITFPDINNITGCLADSIPLRIQAGDAEQNADLIEQVKIKLHEGAKHNNLSSMDYSGIKNSRHQSGPSGITPFGMSFMNFDTVLKNAAVVYPEIHCRSALPFTGLSLISWMYKGRLVCSWNYSSETISYEEIKNSSDEYKKILLEENKQSDKSGYHSCLKYEMEMPSIRLYPTTSLIHKKVFMACEKYKDQKAVVFDSAYITYAELKKRSLCVSNLISKYGDPSKEAIGIFAFPGIEAPFGILGILDAGFAFLPLDPEWPDARLAQIISHSEIDIILTTSKNVKRLTSVKDIHDQLKLIIVLDDGDNQLLFYERLEILHYAIGSASTFYNKVRHINGESLVYIMYTSGTTGVPKGVMVQHAAVEVFLNWVSEEFEINTNDRYIHSSSLGFDASIRQIFSTLLAGAIIYPIDRMELRDPQSLLNFLEENKITILNTVPTILHSVAEIAEYSVYSKISLDALRLVLVGGEVIHPETIIKWRRIFGNRHQVVNMYGATETIVNALTCKLDEPANKNNPVPIGLPRKGSMVLLINDKGNLCNADEPGEIIVGGPGIAKGYFKNAVVTSQKFVHYNHAGYEGVFYNTGDLAKRDQSGIYYFLGRNDDQVQIYGNRVQLSEVEMVLCFNEKVKKAAVIYFNEEGEHLMVAFVVLNTNQNNIDGDELRNFVAEKLPGYMVPHKIEFLEDLPVNHAGKSDRLKLRQQYKKHILPGTEPAELNPTEKIILGIWEEIIKDKNI